jgi:hypothetical protein
MLAMPAMFVVVMFMPFPGGGAVSGGRRGSVTVLVLAVLVSVGMPVRALPLPDTVFTAASVGAVPLPIRERDSAGGGRRNRD